MMSEETPAPGPSSNDNTAPGPAPGPAPRPAETATPEPEKTNQDKVSPDHRTTAETAPEAEATTEMSSNEGQGTCLPDVIRFPMVLMIVGMISALLLAFLYSKTEKKIKQTELAKTTSSFSKILGEAYASSEKTETDKSVYKLFDAEKKLIGYAATASCPGSYNAGDPVQVVVITDVDVVKIMGALAVKSAETPGLGELIRTSPSAASLAGKIAGAAPKRRLVLKEGGALLGVVTESEGKVSIIVKDGEKKTFAAEDVTITDAPFPPPYMDQFTRLDVSSATLSADGGAIDAISGATITSRAVVRGVAIAIDKIEAAK